MVQYSLAFCAVLIHLLVVVEISVARSTDSDQTNGKYFESVNSNNEHSHEEDNLMELYDGSNCDRECVVGEEPRICYFKLVIDNSKSMGP